MGGSLAAATAAADPRIWACCVNGGTVRPVELPERYPRFETKLQAVYGIDDPGEAMRAMEDATIGPTELERLRCPLLVLHGTPDQVFLVENAWALYDAAASVDKTWREWPDGDNCIYNHTAEKHAIIGDWFTDKLRQHAPTHGSGWMAMESWMGSGVFTYCPVTARRPFAKCCTRCGRRLHRRPSWMAADTTGCLMHVCSTRRFGPRD